MTARGFRRALRRGLYLVQYLYFQRFPLAFLLLLWTISIGALRGNSVLSGCLETVSPRATSFLAATALFLSWLIVSAFFLTWRHGEARFGVRLLWHPFAGAAGRLRLLPAAFVAALPLWAIFASRHHELTATVAGLAIAAAVIVVFGTLSFLDELLSLTRSPARRIAKHLRLPRPIEWVTATTGWLARFLGPGYWEPGSPGRIAEGQARAVVGFVALAVLYISVYLVWQAGPPVEGEPAGAFLLLFLSLLLSGLAGAAFLLDRYRVPVLLSSLAVLILLYGANGADHYFEVEVIPPDERLEPVSIPTAVRARLRATAEGRAESARPVLVVATVSGGGIQATAWAGRVLTSLEEATAADAILAERGILFLESLQLISSVSGGSVGALELLAAMQQHGPSGPWATEELARIRRATKQSSLAALGWAIVYPEFLRVLLPGYDSRKDRGWALERAWSRTLRQVLGVDRHLYRANWAREVNAGRLPGMVFNSTIVETGSPLFLTPLATDDMADGYPDFGIRQLLVDPDAETSGFLDIDMVQAARLSSSFPYLGPPAAPRCVAGPCPAFGAYHVVDGGYFDNYGITAAVAWLQELRAAVDFDIGHAFGAVAIVEIKALPEPVPRAPIPTRWTGIYTELLGPAIAMVNMRRTSQTVRDDIEVKSLCAILEQGGERDAVPCEQFVFQPPPDVRPPVSWHLRAEDAAAIDSSWERIAQPASDDAESSLARLLAYMRAHSAPLPPGAATDQPAGR